jgi:GNAT superfamily N-acetyltransferase
VVEAIVHTATHGDLQGLGLGSRLIAAAERCIRRRGLARVGVPAPGLAFREYLGYRRADSEGLVVP